MLPVIAAMVSLSPPIETASQIALSKSVLSRNATMACGTVTWHVSLNVLVLRIESQVMSRL